MKNKKKKLNQKISTKLGTIVLIIIALTVGGFVWKIGKDQEGMEQSQNISPRQIENSGYAGELATYSNCKNGYSFSYPKESKVIETLNGDNFVSGTSISITTYDDLHSSNDFLTKYSVYRFPDKISNTYQINGLTVSQLENAGIGKTEIRYLIVRDKVFYLEAKDQDAAILNTVIQSFSTAENNTCQYDLAVPTGWNKFNSSDGLFTLSYPSQILKSRISKGSVDSLDHGIYTDFRSREYEPSPEFSNFEIEIVAGDMIPVANSSYYVANPGYPLNTSDLEYPEYYKDTVFKGYPCKIAQQFFNGGWREAYFFNLGKKYVEIKGFVKDGNLDSFYNTYLKILNSFKFNKQT